MAERSARVGSPVTLGWRWTKACPSPSILETAAVYSGGADRAGRKRRVLCENRSGGREHGAGAAARDRAASALRLSRGVREAFVGGEGARGRGDGRGVGPFQPPEGAHTLDRPEPDCVVSFVVDTALVVPRWSL